MGHERRAGEPADVATDLKLFRGFAKVLPAAQRFWKRQHHALLSPALQDQAEVGSGDVGF